MRRTVSSKRSAASASGKSSLGDCGTLMKGLSKPAGKCIFCGNGNLSKEHIWPEWANPYIVKHSSKQRVEHFYTIDSDKVPKKLIYKTQQGDVTTKKLRLVCTACNNGWMSQIENKAKPNLLHLIEGSQTMLSQEGQDRIARWVSLKLMIMEHTEPAAIISTKECMEVFKVDWSPPIGMHIWAGDCGQAHWVSAFFRTAATVTDSPLNIPPIEPDGTRRKNAHYVTFGIGRAFFFVFYTTNLTVEPVFHFNSVVPQTDMADCRQYRLASTCSDELCSMRLHQRCIYGHG